MRQGLRFLSLLYLAAQSLAAQSTGSSSPNGAAHAAPRAAARDRAGSISIDGRLTEIDWATAPVATGFIQRQPDEGRPAEHQTDVRVLFDGEAMYVAARMHDPDPTSIARQMTRRDEEGQFDYFAIEVDPPDRRTGYRFRVSASNVQRESTCSTTTSVTPPGTRSGNPRSDRLRRLERERASRSRSCDTARRRPRSSGE